MQRHKQHIFKIVLTGPESSGKKMLAKALADVLKTAWVPEFARFFVAHLGRSYVRDDLFQIARGQMAWEHWYSFLADQVLICDTDWTVLQIWEHYRFGLPLNGIWTWQRGYPVDRPADLYLLCAPDFPWQPDPLREHPEEREILFSWYKRLLQEKNLPYEVLSGNHTDRVSHAISRIKKLSRTL